MITLKFKTLGQKQNKEIMISNISFKEHQLKKDNLIATWPEDINELLTKPDQLGSKGSLRGLHCGK